MLVTAARAGVAVGSLYQYFPDKQALLDELVARHVREARSTLDAVCAELREDCVREVAFHLSRRPGTADPDGLARTLVHAVDGLLHHAPAAAGVQRERVRELARLVGP
ncbi:helix-turn-helix domain-containing protein [Pseudonocardia alni]|uniref:helix-turn-helix domain-containing protein n=1 Tax=Pseudonocardia alni TaxID=33907 RepID=UPI0033223384